MIQLLIILAQNELENIPARNDVAAAIKNDKITLGPA